MGGTAVGLLGYDVQVEMVSGSKVLDSYALQTEMLGLRAFVWDIEKSI